MENKPNNPFAFPAEVGSRDALQNGMTLRDYHASKFMQVYLSEHLKALSENRCYFSISDMVESSYIIAKEMLKQREL